MRRGVTVVGDSSDRETEFISHRRCARESMAGRSSLCQTGYEGSLVSTVRLLRGRDVVYAETVRAPSLREICGSREMRGLETRLAASGSGESAYF